ECYACATRARLGLRDRPSRAGLQPAGRHGAQSAALEGSWFDLPPEPPRALGATVAHAAPAPRGLHPVEHRRIAWRCTSRQCARSPTGGQIGTCIARLGSCSDWLASRGREPVAAVAWLLGTRSEASARQPTL